MTNIQGVTASSYTTITAGSCAVVITNTNNCSATSSVTTVTVNNLPIPSITASGATTFCQGGSVVLNANIGSDLTYQWKKNGTNVTAATAASYTANTTGSYAVVVTNANNCYVTSTTVGVTVKQLPAVTLASITSPLCVNQSTIMLNGTPQGGIYSGSGVNGSIFDPSISGVGTFTVTYNYTDVNNCNADANRTIEVSSCTTIAELNQESVLIYPNPTNDMITLKMVDFSGKTATVKIYDIAVKLIIEEKLTHKTTDISIKALADGLYTAKINLENKQFIKQIIKQ